MAATDDTNATADLTQLLGKPVASLDRIGEGRNSRAFRVNLRNGETYAAKQYFQDDSDQRDRLGVEFNSLRFLWDKGVRCIPQPIAAASKLGWAVYEFVGETKLPSAEITESDIDFAVDFLVSLVSLKQHPESADLPPASEASFSAKAIFENIVARLERLQKTADLAQDTTGLAEFLSDEFRPAIAEIETWCRAQSKRSGISYDLELSLKERSLSPSDFGFHNAVRRDDGSTVFLDLEYFGWDDPAKTVSDFLLHPAMDLSNDLLRRYASSMVAGFSENQNLANRTRLVYPLFGLKWCLILLNEFLPERMARRGFASGAPRDGAAVRAEQLAKARSMLARTLGEYDGFPYLD